MLLPFQQYQFTAPGTLRELKRKMELMDGQFHPERKQKTLFNRAKRPGLTRYICSWHELAFTVVAMKPDGDEDIVRVAGVITPGDRKIKVDTQFRYTPAWLVNIALGVVMACAIGYTWFAIAEALFSLVVGNTTLIYLGLAATAIYINFKLFHNKASRLMEELMYWLELSEIEQ